MPAFQIAVINDIFEASNEQDLPDMASARIQGLKSALEVGVEQMLASGKPIFGAEVTVSGSSERQRFIVSMATSPLK
jgi:hypothetical protein